MFCPRCGRNNPVTAKFCNECGFDLHEIRSILDKQKEIGEVPPSAPGPSAPVKKEDPKKPYVRTTSPLPPDVGPASAQYALIPESRQATVSDRIRNPSLAVALSLLPGLGQVYNGMLARGIVLFIATVLGLLIYVIPGVCVWIYCIYDAYTSAGKINRGEVPFGLLKD